jgi:Leucine carboxyl methyltransferase
MTAACRAIETGRPDGLMQDPLAERLAGGRGMAIAYALPRLDIMCFGVGIRSRLLDELVLKTISANRISTVLSVGAGLDTRPWRLDLPADLHWIEVDLPAILDYKAAILDSEKPSCHVERLKADLNDPERRCAMLAAASEPALMITEGPACLDRRGTGSGGVGGEVSTILAVGPVLRRTGPRHPYELVSGHRSSASAGQPGWRANCGGAQPSRLAPGGPSYFRHAWDETDPACSPGANGPGPRRGRSQRNASATTTTTTAGRFERRTPVWPFLRCWCPRVANRTVLTQNCVTQNCVTMLRQRPHASVSTLLRSSRSDGKLAGPETTGPSH